LSTGATKRTPRRHRRGGPGTHAQPGPKRQRITKKTEDVRSKPDRGRSPRGPLSGKALRHLRALGHHLRPVVQIGKEGVTDAVVAATRTALSAHELVKVKLGGEAPVDRKSVGAELAARAGAELAQTLGRTLLLYKRHPHTPKIELPR
jgi:RNA-binding protein